MNGAESLVRTLINADVEVCFANPGTSEMHFVAALDRVGGIRCVLGLFEGVVTGAADGYARMKDKPAVTLLHLGPGLGNGLANLHNARKASTSVVNVVGEHASWHIEHDAPLTADIEGIARPVSHWVKTAASAADVTSDAAAAVAAANTYPGQIATLILPANTAWEEGSDPAPTPNTPTAPVVPSDRVNAIAEVLARGEPTAFILSGKCVRAKALEIASRIAQKTGATLLSQTSNARVERGAGRVYIKPVPYPVDQALETLKPFRHIITVCAKAPVAFFAYPDKPSLLYAKGSEVHTLASPEEDGSSALSALAELLDLADVTPLLQAPELPPLPADGPLTAEAICTSVANHIPDNAIIIDEAITAGRDLQFVTRGSPRHDWLQICGGAIGAGFPLATGAAVACPERHVIALQADGSGMYTLQALWTQARESLNITTIIFSNRCYAILKHELKNVRATSGDIANNMMELTNPDLDWVSLAAGMGVNGVAVSTVADFQQALAAALEMDGPYLIEAVI